MRVECALIANGVNGRCSMCRSHCDRPSRTKIRRREFVDDVSLPLTLVSSRGSHGLSHAIWRRVERRKGKAVARVEKSPDNFELAIFLRYAPSPTAIPLLIENNFLFPQGSLFLRH